jgi:hypothetical protein
MDTTNLLLLLILFAMPGVASGISAGVGSAFTLLGGFLTLIGAATYVLSAAFMIGLVVVALFSQPVIGVLLCLIIGFVPLSIWFVNKYSPYP